MCGEPLLLWKMLSVYSWYLTIMTMNYFFSFLGEPHICQNLNQFGHGKGTPYGGCSEYTIIPAIYAYLLQTDLDDSRAAILER